MEYNNFYKWLIDFGRMKLLDYVIMPLGDLVLDSRLRSYNVAGKIVGGFYLFGRNFVGNIRDDRRFARRMKEDRIRSERAYERMRERNKMYSDADVRRCNLANLNGSLGGC